MKRRIGEWLKASIFFPIVFAMQAIGLRGAVRMGGALGRVVNRLASKQNAKIDRDMQAALPDLTPHERRAIIKKMWHDMGYHLAEMPHTARLWKENQRRIRIINPHHATQTVAKHGQVIFITGHFSNYEVMSAAVQKLLGPCASIYRPARSAFLTRLTLRWRAAISPYQIPADGDSTRRIIRILQRKIPIQFAIDQGRTQGVEISFFGRRVRAPIGAAKLARRFAIPLVPMVVRRTPKGRDPSYFEVEFYPPIRVAKGKDSARDVQRATQKMNDFIAERVRERPHEWAWSYGRWRYSPPPDDTP